MRPKGKPTSARPARRSGTFDRTLQGCLRFALATLLLAIACRPAETPTPAAPAECVDRYDSEVDCFPAKAAPRFAERFRVEYFRHHKVVTVTPPWDGAPLRYVLVQCGTPPPEGWDEEAIIEIPVRSVVTTSTTELPHLVALGLVDRLVGHDELDYVNAPEIRRRIAAGELAEVGSGGRINVERVVVTAPDLVLAAGWGDGRARGVREAARARGAGGPGPVVS